MKRTSINYFDGQQTLMGELFSPAMQERKTAVLLFPAFEGRGEFSLNYAEKLAQHGHTVFVADMYGDATVSHTIEGCFKLITPFLQDRELVRRRAVLAYKTLLQQSGIDKNKVGAIGFCFGGMCVLELARSGAEIYAGVSLHGVLAKSNLPTHPIKSKLLMLHGYQDPQVPPTELPAFANEMSDAGVLDWTFTFFGNAKHSFTDPKTGTFDPQIEKEMGREYHAVVADRSFQYVINFL